MRNLEVKQVKQKKSFNELELSPQRVPKQEIMHFSAPDGGVRAHGHPDHRSARGRRGRLDRTSASARSSPTMREQINNGVPFSDALAEHAKVFPPYYIGILKSAELTGQLDVSLEQLSSYIERDLDSQSKIKAAMIYPMVIAGMSLMTVVILAVWVMPKFVVFFKNLDAKLPLPTMLLIKASRRLAEVLVRRGRRCSSRSSRSMLWMHKSAAGRLLRDRLFLRAAARQGDRALRGHRAGVPHPRRDGEGRCAAARRR